MAPKRSNPAEVPPAASSSEEEDEEVTSSEEEEEEEGSSEDEEAEAEEEEEPKTQKSPPPKKSETAAPAVAVDESEETASDSESESDTATPNVKPIATKPMEETSNVKKPRSKPLASPVKASSSKRPSESEQEAKEAKRPRKKAGEEGKAAAAAAVVEEVKKTGEDAKKQLFQRLFSEDDEIAVLKGMLDYSEKKGADPCADMNAFYDYVKKSIHTDVTKAQLMDKIRRLRKKFENNAGKGKKGEDRTFSKAHEQNAFELSKKIWGKEGISGKVESSAAKSNGKAKGNSKTVIALKVESLSSPEKKVDGGVPMEVDKKVPKSFGSLFDKRFGVASLEEEVLKHGLDMIEGEKKAVLEMKWRKLQIAELELFVQRTELVNEHAKLLLEFYKSEDK